MTSVMATFMKETQHDIHDREREKKKLSVHPPAGDHRLAVTLSQDTMKMLNELVFLRRQRTYREGIESLIAIEYGEQIAREAIERIDMTLDLIATPQPLKPATYKGYE